ncbi:hypothetical protein Tther_00034 [Tepidimonas thermarum]|uniref:Lipoprotein n=1 Tax=Tepidimonas thermarum TaxID=335431 RepID=A0A554X8U0_9BURK|nr:hypothetical protein [Tepidimonas thermarum]TSE32248.1 hypothetical protein Tther_00034 [Tepidimonas thermarum]
MRPMQWSAVAAAALWLVGCATQPTGSQTSTPAAATSAAAAPAAPAAASAAAPAAAPAAVQAQEFFVVLPEDGRYYAFGSAKLYQDFLAHGEVALTRSRIGAGPNGQTIVFGITNDDVKAGKPSAAELTYDGKLPPAPQFYGEVFKNGRYYVFDDLKALLEFASHGEVPYSYTDIGAGPNGATLVWVMDKNSYAKGKPTERLQRFQALRAGK